jgi:hypothetical protein
MRGTAMMGDEIKHGIEYLRDIFQSGKVLRLGEPQVLGNFNYWHYFLVTAYEKRWDFAASRDDLSDLPAMRKWQPSANWLARGLEQRFRNVSPNLFWSVSGRALEIGVQWPREAWSNRTASYLRVHVLNKATNEFANCFVTVTHQQDIFELKEDPFQLHAALANSIRVAVEAGSITFYPSAQEHPLELQQVPLRFDAYALGNTAIDTFLKQKVLSLGFKSGGSDTSVWIADPWDAQYLGTSPQALRQEAEILEAEEFFILSEDRLFAQTGKKLLLEERSRRAAADAAQAVTPATKNSEQRDVFISHASEDKPFARELADELARLGLTYWLDEREITVGDSLREVIDAGLRSSRFGAVILSQHFFAKRWPQRELDGLLALEIDKKVILPVWHGIGSEEIRTYSPMLAGRYAARSSEGAATVAAKILAAVRAHAR